jgi:hypothetical protein
MQHVATWAGQTHAWGGTECLGEADATELIALTVQLVCEARETRAFTTNSLADTAAQLDFFTSRFEQINALRPRAYQQPPLRSIIAKGLAVLHIGYMASCSFCIALRVVNGDVALEGF